MILSLLLTGCVTETGNPELDVSMAITGTSSDGRVAVSHLPYATIESAFVLVDDVRLVEADGCETAAEVEHDTEGPFAVDLLAAEPFTVDLAAPATDYCRLRVRLDRSDGEAGLPDAMDDHAVYIAGTRVDHAPFVLRSRETFEFDLRARSDAFTLDEGRSDLLLAFDIGAWIAAIDLDAATPDGDGVVRIDEDHEEDLLEAFEDAVEAALALYEDDDGDGALDPDDDTLAD